MILNSERIFLIYRLSIQETNNKIIFIGNNANTGLEEFLDKYVFFK